eukprot:3646402-Prymnesium_polylepis.1
MSHVISSRNIFIDSSADVGQGDNFTLELGADSIRAGDGQQLKLALLQFNMYSNFYTVNVSNNRILLETNQGGTDLIIPPGNYETVGQIAKTFADLVLAQVLADARAQSGLGANLTASVSGINDPDVQPLEGRRMDQNSDRIMEFKMPFSAPHSLTAVRLRCMEADGESFSLLGGDRIASASIMGSSFTHQSTSLLALYPTEQ